MASGDVTLFNRFVGDLGLKLHNLNTDTFKLGLITNSVAPTAADADPRWGTGGTTNLSTNEVTPGGNYTAGGPTIANTSYSETSGTGTFDGDDISVAQNASNPTNARWGIIYNDTDTGKRAVGFLDLGAVVDLSAGPFAVTWNASGITRISKSA